MATMMAGLRGWIEPVYLNLGLAVPLRLVLQHGNEFAPASIRNRLGKIVVSWQHYISILYCDQFNCERMRSQLDMYCKMATKVKLSLSKSASIFWHYFFSKALYQILTIFGTFLTLLFFFHNTLSYSPVHQYSAKINTTHGIGTSCVDNGFYFVDKTL